MQATLLAAIDRCAHATGLLRRPFNDSALIAAAQKRAGSGEFGADGFREPLRLLLRCYATESDLSFVGRMAVRWDVIRFLTNLLRLAAEERAEPAITSRPVPAPIFITGLPRSGTTFLHMLLAQDPANRVPLSWEVMRPYPDPRRRRRDRRVQHTEREFRIFRRLAPGLEKLHPLAATTPQECTEITSSIFQSLRYDTIYRVPSYLGWLERRGHDQAFRFHRRFLQHLQVQDPDGARRRWVLKSPDHVFTLKHILQVYPDAGFVFVHRDPTSVLPSVAKLTEVLRAPFTRTLNRVALGAEVAHRCAQGADRILSASEFLPESQVLHLHYNEITRDPIGVLERLDSHFQMSFGDDARERVRRFLARRPRGGYGINHYDPEEFGLDLTSIRRLFEPYLSVFGRLAAPVAG